MSKKFMIESMADRFLMEYEGTLNYNNRFDTSGFKGSLRSALYDIEEGVDQLVFLKRVQIKNQENKSEHLVRCSFLGDKEKCPETNFFNELNYFTVQAIKTLHINEASGDKYSTEEKVDLDKKIDEVLRKLNELQLGQEIIYNEVDDLKNLKDLTKKNFKEVVKGKIVDVVISKGVENDVLKWIYKTITNENFPNLLN